MNKRIRTNTLSLLSITALALCCTAPLAAAPVLAGVVNGASWVFPTLPNSGIAQGAIFTVVGTGLGPSTYQGAGSFPLPTTQGLAGTTITVTVAGVTKTCIMLYTVASQVAAILPSATPLGAGTMTLSYQGESGSIPIEVVAANLGTFALNSDGTGPGVFTDLTYTPITYIHTAHPGDTVVLWGSGLGAITGDETEPPPATGTPLDTGEVQVLVGNQPATVGFSGRSGYAGLDQINFVVPAGVTGCKTSVAVVVKGITGNVTSMAVAPAGQTTCADDFGSLTAANLQKAIANGSLNGASVQLSHTVDGGDKLEAAFANYPVNSLIRSYAGALGPSKGSCLVYEPYYSSSLNIIDPIQPTYLDAGSQLTLTGPGGSKTVNATSTGLYQASLATSSPFFLSPGNYTVSNGSGGAKVGAFNWNLTLPSGIVPTNLPSSIDRSQDLTLNWTGGTGFSVATIFGYSAVPITTTLFSWVYFICDADPSAGKFTIPSAILNLLPANGYGAVGERGVSIQMAGIPLESVSAPGIDVAVFSAFIASGGVAKVQ
jgi:uncharacterized protein (TIGR03437 family)